MCLQAQGHCLASSKNACYLPGKHMRSEARKHEPKARFTTQENSTVNKDFVLFFVQEVINFTG